MKDENKGFNDLISVIVPAYNAERSIKKCINSIQNQTYPNIEIIIINDGSTDSTASIVEDMMIVDSRIKVINKINEGVSSARNDGVQLSDGDYITFIDSDDDIDKDMIRNLYVEMVRNNCEISICGFNNVYNDAVKNFSLVEKCKVINVETYIVGMSKYLYSVYYGALWNKLYRTDIIKDNNIIFEKEIAYAEDFLFNVKYLQNVQNIVMLPETLYNYNQYNCESLSKNKDEWYIWKANIRKLNEFINLCKEKQVLELCKQNIINAVAEEVIGPTYYLVNDLNINKKEAIDKIKSIYENLLIREAVKKTQRPVMVHRIAKIAYMFRSYKLLYLIMKLWVKVQKYKK